MTSMIGIHRHIISDAANTLGRYVWRFPNGRTASVIPDPTVVLRWELLVDSGPDLEPGLTSNEVEARLVEIAGQQS